LLALRRIRTWDIKVSPIPRKKGAKKVAKITSGA